VIRSEQVVRAEPEVVHDLITDVSAWSVWSPHVASVQTVRGDTNRVHEGWTGRVRPWFGPPTTMTVTQAPPGEGIRWRTRALGYELHYRDGVEPAAPGSARVVFEAALDGPGADVLERLVAPLSALGQQRRIRRLGALAELVTARQASDRR
jgi:hypothetical protein